MFKNNYFKFYTQQPKNLHILTELKELRYTAFSLYHLFSSFS